MSERKYETFMSILLGIITLGIYPCFEWDIHKSMTKGSTRDFINATYSQFLEKFNSTKWEATSRWGNSVFGEDNTSRNFTEMHASIICFNGMGYVLSPWGLFKANILKRKTIKNARRDNVD